jgi:hypothetical protein
MIGFTTRKLPLQPDSSYKYLPLSSPILLSKSIFKKQLVMSTTVCNGSPPSAEGYVLRGQEIQLDWPRTIRNIAIHVTSPRHQD